MAFRFRLAVPQRESEAFTLFKDLPGQGQDWWSEDAPGAGAAGTRPRRGARGHCPFPGDIRIS